MPADDFLQLHNDQNLSPVGPGTSKCGPTQPVKGVQFRARPFALEDRDLLAQGEDLQGSIAPGAEEDSDGGEERKVEFDHEHMAVICRNAASAGHRLRTASGRFQSLMRFRLQTGMFGSFWADLRL
jgi:hypothetical protein